MGKKKSKSFKASCKRCEVENPRSFERKILKKKTEKNAFDREKMKKILGVTSDELSAIKAETEILTHVLGMNKSKDMKKAILVYDYFVSKGYTPDSKPGDDGHPGAAVHIDFGLFKLSTGFATLFTGNLWYAEFFLLRGPKDEKVLEEIGEPLNRDVDRFENHEETCTEIDRLISIVKRHQKKKIIHSKKGAKKIGF